MIGYIILISALVVAYKTNPTEASFRNYISNASSQNANRATLSSWLNTLLPTRPEFTHTDYVFFSIVSAKRSSATYLGCFGQWFLVSEMVQRQEGGRGGSEQENLEMEERANAEKDAAVKAKVKRDYKVAGDRYVSAAKKFEMGMGEYQQMEAAMCYEEAYKAYKNAKEPESLEKALNCLDTAAKLFAAQGKQLSRAARLFDTLAENHHHHPYQPNLDKAASYYAQAADYYEADGDGRALFSLSKQVELLLELNRYDQALKLLERVVGEAERDSALQFKVKDYLLWGLLCGVGLGDWEEVRKMLDRYETQQPTFSDTRECTLVRQLLVARDNVDPDGYGEACKRYDSISPLKPWQITALLSGKKELETEEGSLR
ncbi:uncharacterized protein VTP21DRAFT_6867 [Calcarisporiella thermophila]|uniref:uncharacterized protein n=1 Tax=Calcarisporiella thermophila TaxID=911321 RepID=UPI00374238EF